MCNHVILNSSPCVKMCSIYSNLSVLHLNHNKNLTLLEKHTHLGVKHSTTSLSVVHLYSVALLFFKMIDFGVWSQDLGYHIAKEMQTKQALTDT